MTSLSALSPRDRRTLLLGAAAIVAILLGSRGVPAYLRWTEERRAAAEEMVAEATRAENDLRVLGAMADSLEARRDRVVALGPAIVDGDSPAAAGAALSSVLASAAAGAGVRLGAVQVSADTAAAGTFRRVGARTDVTGDLSGIARFLSSLERAPELLAVREVAITQPDAGGAPDRPEALRLELSVEGLALVRRTGASTDTASLDAASTDSASVDRAPTAAPSPTDPSAPGAGSAEVGR